MNHLAEALTTYEVLIGHVGRMVGHVSPNATDAEDEALFNAAFDLIYSDAVDAAMKLPDRARVARINALWREWI